MAMSLADAAGQGNGSNRFFVGQAFQPDVSLERLNYLASSAT